MVAYNKPQPKQELKEKLIRVLEDSPCRNQISKDLDYLKKPEIKIPESDTEKVIHLILLMMEKNPNLLDHLPVSQEIKSSARRGR